MILRMGFQMVGKLGDALTEKSDLNVSAARVFFV
jgi:hypothetical protein